MQAARSVDGVVVCAVVPMYNESAVVGTVVRDLLAQLPHVVCVDDGSSDDSADQARAAGATIVRHPVNLGQGAALETGIRFALQAFDADYVVTFDADGQHDVHDALAMVEEAQRTDTQVVLGSRFLSADDAAMPATRRLVLRAATRFTRLTTGLELSDAHNGLRVLRADAAARVRIRLHGMAHASELLEQVAREGWSYREYPVSIAYTDYSRAKGQRGWNGLNILFDLAVNRLRAAAS